MNVVTLMDSFLPFFYFVVVFTDVMLSLLLLLLLFDENNSPCRFQKKIFLFFISNLKRVNKRNGLLF